jgi:hypoxanthine phosphoribosyltransferase
MDALQLLRQGYDMEFVRPSSYRGMNTTGRIKLLGGLTADALKGRHVLIVEDIVDTGTTLSQLIPILQNDQPASVEVVTLLDKRLPNSKKKYRAKYTGFSIPDKFIVGYGYVLCEVNVLFVAMDLSLATLTTCSLSFHNRLDYDELYRDLRDIFIISQAGIDYDRNKLRSKMYD